MESSFARSDASRLAPRSLRRIRAAVEPLEGRCLLSAASSFVAGELIVGFRPGVAASDIAQFYQQHGLQEFFLSSCALGVSRSCHLDGVPFIITRRRLPTENRRPNLQHVANLTSGRPSKRAAQILSVARAATPSVVFSARSA